jgi:hypothetical protein
MKRWVACLLISSFMLAPVTANAAPPEGARQKAPAIAAENCGSVIQRQSERGIAAGGGPKAGILAPANCDWFFFAIGAIGGT